MAGTQDDVTQQAGVARQEGVQPGVGAGVHKTKASSWITVALIVVAAIILGFALPLMSLPLAIVGVVVGLIGVVVGASGRIMDDAH